MSSNPYNGYTWAEREPILKALTQARRSGRTLRSGPCDMCGDPDRPTAFHSEDYSPPYTFQPPQTYLLCKSCHSRIHKRFNDQPESWKLFLAHLRAGGYGAEFSQRYSMAERKRLIVELAAGNQVQFPVIRSRPQVEEAWWEHLTLDPESLVAPWARPRPLRPRPSLEQLQSAIEQIGPSEKELRLLRCHAAAPNRTATMRHLAQHALNSEQPSSANLAYGSFARRLCEAIPEWQPDPREDGSPIWMSIVAEGWQPEGREFEWVLIPDLQSLFSSREETTCAGC